jgi:hypothetical protein
MLKLYFLYKESVLIKHEELEARRSTAGRPRIRETSTIPSLPYPGKITGNSRKESLHRVPDENLEVCVESPY